MRYLTLIIVVTVSMLVGCAPEPIDPVVVIAEVLEHYQEDIDWGQGHWRTTFLVTRSDGSSFYGILQGRYAVVGAKLQLDLSDFEK